MIASTLLYSSIGLVGVVNYDIIFKTISFSINNLGKIYHYMGGSKDDLMVIYKDEIENLDIELKLKFAKLYLNRKNDDDDYKLIHDNLCNTCQKIGEIISSINNKIEEHKQKWFHSWRKLYIEEELKELKKQANILTSRLQLIKLFS